MSGIHVKLVVHQRVIRRFIGRRGNVTEFRCDQVANFIGATEDFGIEMIRGPVKKFLDQSRTKRIINAPHSSYMEGVWKRMIGNTRCILDALLLGAKGKNLTHKVLCALMVDVSALTNSRPITTMSNDPDMPFISSPTVLDKKKIRIFFSTCVNVNICYIYKQQWKQVQVLSDFF
jgi:hypothetical protein